MKARLLQTAVLVAALSLALPTVAGARWLRQDDRAKYASVWTPNSLSTSTFSMGAWARFFDSSDRVGRSSYFGFTGSKRLTEFRVWNLDGDSAPYVRRVNYSQFATYLGTYGSGSTNVRYVWKTNSKGRRYRFAQVVELRWYAPSLHNAPSLPVSATADPVLNTRKLLNMEYANGNSRVRIRNGAWVESGSSPWRSSLNVEDTLQRGDLNGDATQDAIVLIGESGGGTGYFRYLGVVLNEAGTARHVESFVLGDRVIIDEVKLEDGRITVRGVVHGEADGMAQPTLPATSVLELRNGRLTVVEGDAADTWQ